MVHRPADSRLLANLLSHEKGYAKHLHALLEPSHVSLSAFSAYVLASPLPVAHAILAVATSLAGADEAPGQYTSAVDDCRDHLKHIKSLEDNVANIIRDREILVTRLIKASKAHNPNPPRCSRYDHDSLNVLQQLAQGQHHGSSSTLSLSFTFSLPTQSLALHAPLLMSAKLSTAQAELQACEAHLANKECELAVGRTNALREGLSIKCRVLVERGWVWSE